MNILNKPVGSLSGEELVEIIKYSLKEVSKDIELEPNDNKRPYKRYVYGIAGIASLFHCSKPTASRIKKSGVIDKAIKQYGRKIVCDAELALELFGQKKGGRK